VKRLDSIIRPNSLEAVKERLVAAGVEGITITEVRGFGRQALPFHLILKRRGSRGASCPTGLTDAITPPEEAARAYT